MTDMTPANNPPRADVTAHKDTTRNDRATYDEPASADGATRRNEIAPDHLPASSEAATHCDEAMRRGIEMRRRIAGDIGRTPGVDDDLYDLIIKYAFGDVWARPGLDIDTRRLLTLSMTLASNHVSEFKIHTRFALKNGMPYDTIKELVLHSAVYCGFPTALGGFRALSEVALELDDAKPA